MKTLEVVDSLAGVTEVAESAYLAEIPGFQVDAAFFKKVGLFPVLDSIEAGSENALGYTVPFTHEPPLWNEQGQYPPHIDGGYRGLSVHHNKRSFGFVQMAQLLDGTQPEGDSRSFTGDFEGDYRFYRGGDIEAVCADIPHGEIYQGEMSPDRLTVFSQGNVDGLPPAIHYFRRTGGVNGWVRYASSYSDQGLDGATLDDHANQFRLRVARDEYASLWNDKRMYEYYAEEEGGLPDGEISESGLSAEEVDRAIKVHPARNIVRVGEDKLLGYRYKKVSTVERVVRQTTREIAYRTSKLRGRR